jgi:hypothetical protein
MILDVTLVKLKPIIVVVALGFETIVQKLIVPPVAKPVVEFVYVTVVEEQAVTVYVPLYPLTEIPDTVMYCPTVNGAVPWSANVNLVDPDDGVEAATAVTASCVPTDAAK